MPLMHDVGVRVSRPVWHKIPILLQLTPYPFDKLRAANLLEKEGNHLSRRMFEIHINIICYLIGCADFISDD